MADSSKAGAPAARVHLELAGDIAIVRLDEAKASIPVLSEERMRSLRETLESLRGRSDISVVIFLGTENGFCAGADIKLIKSISNMERGTELARMGQETFQMLAALPMKTVAAIHGACVGGGCELALACDFRVATDASATRVGLPEVNIGIIPGFGGTQRLPRLIGLPQALDIILNGKMLSASRAQRAGLLDYVLAVGAYGADTGQALAKLIDVARDIALGRVLSSRRSLRLVDRFVTFTSVGRGFVERKAQAKLQKNARWYPAPKRALQAALEGLTRGEAAGLAAEAQAIGELIVSSVSKALVHVYLLSENAKSLGRAVKGDVSDWEIGVIGAGVMGSGVASTCLQRGFRVKVSDPQEQARARCRAHVESQLQKRRDFSAEKREEVAARLSLEERVEALAKSKIIIEAAVENMVLKQEIFGRCSQVVADDAVLASNTSSLSVTEIARGCKLPERVIGMHFFNPVEKMLLVEVIRGKETDEKTTLYVSRLATALGKFPVVVEDVPGFLVNRILTPYLVESAHLLQEGYSIATIDTAATEFGMPMGPLRLLDEVGLDVAGKVAEVLEAAYGKRMSGPHYAKTLAAAGRLGKKSGKGFYDYAGGKESADGSIGKVLGVSAPEPGAEDVQDRLILVLVNEAIRCLDEGVAGRPGADAAGQIDLASVMGFGFPPFIGGVLRYAESIGVEALRNRLTELAQRYGERFSPWEGIVRRAQQQRSFYESITLDT